MSLLEDAVKTRKKEKQLSIDAANAAFTAADACRLLKDKSNVVCEADELIEDVDARGYRSWAYKLNSVIEDGGELLAHRSGEVFYQPPDYLADALIGPGPTRAPMPESPMKLQGSFDPVISYLENSYKRAGNGLSNRIVLCWAFTLFALFFTGLSLLAGSSATITALIGGIPALWAGVCLLGAWMSKNIIDRLDPLFSPSTL